MTITDLIQQKKKGRLNVYIDGEYVCSLEEITVLEYRIKVGMEITHERLLEIKTESEKETAFDKALKYVTRYARSEKQMRDYLLRKEYVDSVIDAVIEKLKYYDYVNDLRFSADYVSYYKESRGVNRIKQDLKISGIGDEIIDQVIQEIDDQYDSCKRHGEKFLKSHSADKIKLYRHLVSKGYDYELVKRVANELIDGAFSDDD